jgi:exosortase A
MCSPGDTVGGSLDERLAAARRNHGAGLGRNPAPRRCEGCSQSFRVGHWRLLREARWQMLIREWRQISFNSAVSRIGWTYVATGLLFVVLPVAIFHQTAIAVVETWYRSNTFNHCFLIIPISVYLAWRQRGELAHIMPAADWKGGVALAFAAVVWLAGDVTRTLVVQEFGLILIIQAMVLTLFGWPVVRALVFPLGYLYFAIPFGAALIPPLQSFTANFAVRLLSASGVPVFLDGNLISIPTGNWYVAEACAGLRYLIASLALGVLFAGLMYRSWWRRAIFLAISVIVPIIANGIRAYGIIFLAYQTDNAVAAGVDHIIYGFIFFTLVTFIVLAVGVAFREPIDERATAYFGLRRHWASVGRLMVVGFLALLPVTAIKAYGAYLDRAPAVQAAQVVLPEIIGTYRRSDRVQDSARVVFAGADAYAHAAYTSDGRQVSLDVGYYVSERPGAEVVSSNHDLAGGKGWRVVAAGSRTARIGGDVQSVRFLRAESAVGGEVIWYWYWVDGEYTGNPYKAKLLQAKVKLLGGVQSSAIIVAEADYTQSPSQADRVLTDFVVQLRNLGPVLQHARQPAVAR